MIFNRKIRAMSQLSGCRKVIVEITRRVIFPFSYYQMYIISRVKLSKLVNRWQLHNTDYRVWIIDAFISINFPTQRNCLARDFSGRPYTRSFISIIDRDSAVTFNYVCNYVFMRLRHQSARWHARVCRDKTTATRYNGYIDTLRTFVFDGDPGEPVSRVARQVRACVA